ncbi:MAG TPA: caspase family protein, partial [Candidatus Syntrophosphaera sp.]|nr:caspase family protein [Candidatus Syntrophosphaera sp.]
MKIRFLLLAGLLMLIPVLHAVQESRIALVIGNSNYSSSPLKNPVNDARAMDKALRDLGFQVTAGYDVKNFREMLRLIQDFGAGLKEGSVGLFYYAGHGVQYNGVNYLIPTQADIRRDQDIELEGVSLDRVLAEMDYAQNDLNIIILDACRNNPYASRLRSPKRGLAATTAKKIPGLLIAYATEPDGVAQDGTGSNGIYTEELLKNIKNPGLSLSQILMKTREGVIGRTDGDQIPWDSSSLTRDFYFARATGNVPATQLPEEAQAQTVRNYGQIMVSSSREADVYLDGSFKGRVSAAADLKI